MQTLIRLHRTAGSRLLTLGAVVLMVAGMLAATVTSATPAYAAGGWSAPTSIDTTAPLIDVSCPTATFCAAVDNTGGALTYNGTNWSGRSEIDPGALNGLSVSCPTAGFCVAVDTGATLKAFLYNGTSWLGAGNNIDPAHELYSVSCASATFCAAVDQDGGVVTFNGANWSGRSDIDQASMSNLYPSFDSVSCPTATFCAAVDDAGNAFIYNGTSWTGPNEIDATNQIDVPDAPLDSVSCPTATFCAAVDDAGNAFIFNGTSWSGPHYIDSQQQELNGVSCPTANFCAAVDGNGNGFIYNGTSWSGPSPFGGNQAVSCPTASLCAAVDDTTGSFYTYTPPSSQGLQIVPTTLPQATVGVSYSAPPLSATGGNPPYSWKLVKGSGKLPKGLKLNKHTGLISGTPKKSDSGTYAFTVSVADTKVKVKHQHPTQNITTIQLSITVS